MYLLLSVLLLCSFCEQSWEVSLEQDLTLTAREKHLLDEFRGEVRLDTLPENYMKEDIYLIRWLRARNFNVDQAKRMLYENLKWRKENNMTTIHQEDWSDMEEDYKYLMNSIDKEGRPIVNLKFGEWDIRRAIVTGRGSRLRRYIYKALDEVTAKVRQLQKEGKQVTQWVSLLDMEGYSYAKHGCIGCLGIYTAYVSAYESYFPGSVHDIILVNTPPLFETVLQATKPLLADRTRNILHIFGNNRSKWLAYLSEQIDKDQLEKNFGGTKQTED